jgi:lambda family phage tail tape measure protein
VVAFTVAAKAAQFAILGLEGISAFISALPAKMAMTGEVTAIGLVANAVVNVGSKLMAAGTVVAAFGARLMALIGSIFAAGEALGGFAGMAVTAVSGMTALSAALGFIVIPTAIIAGLALIIGKFQEWTRVADETGRAVGDALQGGVTSGTEAAAKSELANIDKKVETLRALEAALVKYQKNPSGSLLTGNMGQVERLLGKMKGFAGTEDFDPNKLGIGGFDFMKPGNIEKALPQIAAILSNWQNTLNEAHESVATIAERRMQADAERATDILMRSIKAGTQKFSTEYKVTIEQIERERDSLKGPAQAKNSPETIGLNNRAIEAAKNYYSQYEQYVLSAIASVQKKMDAATTDGDKSRYAMEIEALRKFYDEFTAAGKEKVDRFGHVVTIGEAKILEKQQHSAESMISTFQTHTAGLMSALDGGGTALARVNEMLSEHGKLAMIGAMNDQTLANTLRALASADDLAKEKTAALRDAMKADQSINTAYDKASADLKSYIARLVDPTMPEAQRSFAQLQSRMSTELVTYSINILRAKGLTEGFVDILREAKKVGDGISYAGLATVLHRIVTAEDEAAKARERNLTPSARLAAVSSRINSQYDALRRQVEGSSEETLAKFAGQYGLTGAPNKSDLLARLEGARQDELAQAGRAYDSAMHKAGMPAENEVAQLTGRIAQLKAELQGGKGEFEKFSAIFQAQPSKYAGSQQAILALAKEADALAEKLKKAHIAQQAMNTLENNAADAQERAALAGELMGQGKLLEIQKQILAYKVREAAEVRKTADFYGVDSPEVARAQALANTANQNNAEALVRTQVETMRTQTNQLRASFAERLSLRREYGEKEIDSEQAKLKTLIGMYETDATKRKEEETALSNYIAAKREDLERKTENGLEKMARKWSDVGANISQFGADAMDKLGDAIDQFVTTGKFKFSDFANWAISQLLKISAQAALSPILKFVGNSIGSWVGGLGGGSGGSTSGFTSALPTPEFHGGGVGGIDSVRMRHIEMSAFASAPRFHTGIGPGEFPAVLQQGEGVFTAGQMAAIGKLNYNYNAIQGVVAALADAVVAIPQAIGGALYSQNNGLYGASPANTAGGSNSAAAPIIHVHNQTQAPVTAEAKAPRFDGEKFIMDIVIKNIKSPGPMRNALRSMK